jgi:hypothetical protein
VYPTVVVVELVAVTVVVVVSEDSHVHAAVHAAPPGQPPVVGSHCSPPGSSTMPSPQVERLAVNAFGFAPLVLKRPVNTPQSGETILAFNFPVPALPQDGHFAVSLVKCLFGVMRPTTARQPLPIEIRPCPSTVTESTDGVLEPWTSGPFPGSTRNRPGGHGVAGAFLGQPSRAQPKNTTRPADAPSTVSRAAIMRSSKVSAWGRVSSQR